MGSEIYFLNSAINSLRNLIFNPRIVFWADSLQLCFSARVASWKCKINNNCKTISKERKETFAPLFVKSLIVLFSENLDWICAVRFR